MKIKWLIASIGCNSFDGILRHCTCGAFIISSSHRSIQKIPFEWRAIYNIPMRYSFSVLTLHVHCAQNGSMNAAISQFLDHNQLTIMWIRIEINHSLDFVTFACVCVWNRDQWKESPSKRNRTECIWRLKWSWWSQVCLVRNRIQTKTFNFYLKIEQFYNISFIPFVHAIFLRTEVQKDRTNNSQSVWNTFEMQHPDKLTSNKQRKAKQLKWVDQFDLGNQSSV